MQAAQGKQGVRDAIDHIRQSEILNQTLDAEAKAQQTAHAQQSRRAMRFSGR